MLQVGPYSSSLHLQPFHGTVEGQIGLSASFDLEALSQLKRRKSRPQLNLRSCKSLEWSYIPGPLSPQRTLRGKTTHHDEGSLSRVITSLMRPKVHPVIQELDSVGLDVSTEIEISGRSIWSSKM